MYGYNPYAELMTEWVNVYCQTANELSDQSPARKRARPANLTG